MPYRLRYSVNVDFVPAGRGLGLESQSSSAVGLAGGEAQTINFQDISTPASTTFTGSDVTALLATMSADLSTQLNANLARIQGFATGGG